MKLDIIVYQDLINHTNSAIENLENALLQKGIVGIKQVPDFENKSRAYVNAARAFSALSDEIKNQYAPNREAGDTEGYELGAEWFKNQNGEWQKDDKKASFYAYVPDRLENKWPKEVDLKTPYLALGELIFTTGKLVLNAMGLNAKNNFNHEHLIGYGRMLHYHKEDSKTNFNPNWCGAHFDHGVLTGLMPAYYFHNGQELAEPEEAGLFISSNGGQNFEKINAADKSILIFQVGEFGQLLTNDRIKATKHFVKKANTGIERFAFALFNSLNDDVIIHSHSILTEDVRYSSNQSADGSLTYGKWQNASFERYRAK